MMSNNRGSPLHCPFFLWEGLAGRWLLDFPTRPFFPMGIVCLGRSADVGGPAELILRLYSFTWRAL